MSRAFDQKVSLLYRNSLISTIKVATAMQFSETVRQLRLRLCQTRQEIAEQTQLFVAYIKKVENERLHFGNREFEKFIERRAEVLKADEDDLLLIAVKVPS